MYNESHLERVKVVRELEKIKDKTAFLVHKVFSNTFSFDRLNNVVQNVTLGEHCLNRERKINSNSKKGFNQSYSYPDPHLKEFEW